ncbi:MAG: TRL domain-containing protein [Bacteroidota bacterium]
MKEVNKFILGAIVAVGISSCSTIYPVDVTNNAVDAKKGTSETTIIFGTAGPVVTPSGTADISNVDYGHGLVLNKNYGVVEAAENGNINKVGAVDLKVTNYILWTKAEIIVSGE